MKNLSLALLFAFFVALIPHGVEIYKYFKHQDTSSEKFRKAGNPLRKKSWQGGRL